MVMSQQIKLVHYKERWKLLTAVKWIKSALFEAILAAAENFATTTGGNECSKINKPVSIRPGSESSCRISICTKFPPR